MVSNSVAAVEEAQTAYGDHLDKLESLASEIAKLNDKMAELETDKEDLFDEMFRIFDEVEGKDSHVNLLLETGMVVGRHKRRKPGTDSVDVTSLLDAVDQIDHTLYNNITTQTRIFDEPKFETALKKGGESSERLANLVKEHTIPLDHTYARICKEASKKVQSELMAAGSRVLRLIEH